MRVRHSGNTANNAFHNVLLLRAYTDIESELPIGMFGLIHGISAPAWEVVDFDVPSAAWVPAPDWGIFPEAAALNTEYSDLVPPAAPTPGGAVAAPGPGMVAVARQRLNNWIGSRRWAQPLVDYRTGQTLAARPTLDEPADLIHVVYGPDSILSQKVPTPAARTVALEHGTVRWAGAGSLRDPVRAAYRQQVRDAVHLWVTNVDPRSLEVAEELAPGRWSAFPHPFMPDPRVPFAVSPRRAELLRETDSESLVLLPSSQNWSALHDKGSIKALNAFIEMRTSGVAVGLVAVEWGLQLAESKELLARAGVDAHVSWVPPMARIGLQRAMADVDVVWDQFGLEAFGALALRAVEQGTPLVSRHLAVEGERLLGGPVPWLHAATTDDIVRQTRGVLADMAVRGRDTVIAEFRAVYRRWLDERHSPALTAEMQRELYTAVLDGSFEPGSAAPDRWAQLVGAAATEG